MPLPATIPIYAQAPLKPEPALPCNGCGVCCLLAPCPLGVMLSGRRTGACAALRWHDDASLYRCGAITCTSDVLRACLPTAWHGLVAPLSWLLVRLAPRWVAAGGGCDCDAQLEDAADDEARP